jgi:hypothetical protein
MGRHSHSKKEIEAAISYAESKGWTVKTAKGSIWGRIYCPHHSRDGCRISVWSTPRVPESHAKDIRRIVDRCNHDGE